MLRNTEKEVVSFINNFSRQALHATNIILLIIQLITEFKIQSN